MQLPALEPRPVWENFMRICAVPHPSHDEERLAAALLSWAAERGIEASPAPGGNVVMRKKASPGREGRRGVILQAHLDMVPQKAADSAHDFARDPILPRLDPADPGWVRATGTTLGADDGMGLAMAMAILEDKGLEHGPLECLFTTNEEDGMSGAREVEEGLLAGSLLLNIDGEDDGELTIGCAGSVRTAATLSRAAVRAPSGLIWFSVTLGGGLGGHSGVDIDKGRVNATLALARLLSRTGEAVHIASLAGGTAANAIPREARAVAGVPAARAAAFRAAFEAEARALRAELGDKDPGVEAAATLLAGAPPAETLAPADAAALLGVLLALPNGLIAMEPDMPGLIRSSLNLGTLEGSVRDGAFTLSTMVMVRSSSDEEKESLSATVERRLGGAGDYGWVVSQDRPSVTPAWSPDLGSPLLAEAVAVYEGLFGRKPRILSTHGGLETGLWRPRFPGWDMLSLGPNIRCPHSPDERVEIASVARSYSFVRALLERL